MLLPRERMTAFNALIVPLLCQLPLFAMLKCSKKADVDKYKSHRYFGSIWTHWIPGILIPSAVQWLYILVGAIIFEALEMEAEEDANPAFSRCLAQSYTRGQCREWEAISENSTIEDADMLAVYATLGMPPRAPWRNFDVCGGAFFCFTLITTVGYGTFAPATSGGKLFACAYLLFGIPMNGTLFAEVGKSLVHLFFGGLLARAYAKARAKLGSSESADTDRSGSVSFDEIKAALARGGLRASDEQVHTLIAEVRDGGGEHAAGGDGGAASPPPTLSYARYEQLLERLAEYATQRRETALTAAAFLFSIVCWAIFLPVSDRDTFGTIDGLYWAVITFSTVGLGDVVIDFASAESLNGQFGYMMFIAVALEMALLATMITTAFEVITAARAILGSRAKMLAAAKAQETQQKSAMLIRQVTGSRIKVAPPSDTLSSQAPPPV